MTEESTADPDAASELRLVVPKGSLETSTFRLFEEADLAILRGSDRDYRASIDDPRIGEVRILRPQEIGKYVEEGVFDLGITGRDWITETAADVESLCRLPFSKATPRPTKTVLAVPIGSGIVRPEDLPDGARVSTELPEMTRRYFEDLGKDVHIFLSYGATEAKVPDIVDAIVDLTETGSSLRRAGLKIIDTLCESYPELIANRESCADQKKREAMEAIKLLLTSAMNARGRVLVKLNCPNDALEAVLDVLPSAKAPTVNALAGDSGYAVEAVVSKATINELIPVLKDRGAGDILELPVTKIVS